MNSTILQKFISSANKQTGSLDTFVIEQRLMNAAMRSREWTALESAMGRANKVAAELVADEKTRLIAWHNLLSDLGFPLDTSSAKVISAIPGEYRAMLGESCRKLKTAGTRARIENDCLRAFAGSAATTLAGIMEELYPDRKGTIYGKSGSARPAGTVPIVLDTAF
jgi:hypothetical protein